MGPDKEPKPEILYSILQPGVTGREVGGGEDGGVEQMLGQEVWGNVWSWSLEAAG